MEKNTAEPIHTRMMDAFHRIRRVNISAMMELPQSEFFALQIISRYEQEHPDREGIYVSELAEKLRIASSQTSRMLRNLEERHFVGRMVDTKDRRNTYVFLTEEGQEICSSTKKRLMAYVAQVREKMGEERIEELIRLCNEMAEIMEQEAKRQTRLLKQEKADNMK